MEIKSESVTGGNPMKESPGARKAITVVINQEYIWESHSRG